MSKKKLRGIFKGTVAVCMVLAMSMPVIAAEVETTYYVAEEGDRISQSFSGTSKTEQIYDTYSDTYSIVFSSPTEGTQLVSYASQTDSEGIESVWTSAYVDDTILSDPDSHKGFPAADEGYTLMVLYNPSVFADKLPDSGECDVVFELPVPEGYDRSSAKYYNNGFVDVDDNTSSGVVVVNAKMESEFSSWAGSIMGYSEGFGLDDISGILVEYKELDPMYFIYEDGTISTEADNKGGYICTVRTSNVDCISYDGSSKTLSLKDADISDGLSLFPPVTINFSGKCNLGYLGLRLSMEGASDKVTLTAAENAVLTCKAIYAYGVTIELSDGVTKSVSDSGEVTYTGPSGDEKDDEKDDETNNIISDSSNTVSISDASGVLPSGTTLICEKVESGEDFESAKALVAEALKQTDSSDGNISVFEINLKNAESVAIHQLDDEVYVTMDVPFTVASGNIIKVYRINDDKTLTECETFVKDSKLTFITDHFSMYVFTEVPSDDLQMNPGAGDANTLVIWFSILAVSICIAVVIGTRKRKIA